MTPEEMQKLINAAKNRDSHALLVTLGVRKPEESAEMENGASAQAEVEEDGNQSIRLQIKKIATDRGRKVLASVISGWVR